jgi:hypothetical protein
MKMLVEAIGERTGKITLLAQLEPFKFVHNDSILQYEELHALGDTYSVQVVQYSNSLHEVL